MYQDILKIVKSAYPNASFVSEKAKDGYSLFAQIDDKDIYILQDTNFLVEDYWPWIAVRDYFDVYEGVYIYETITPKSKLF